MSLALSVTCHYCGTSPTDYISVTLGESRRYCSKECAELDKLPASRIPGGERAISVLSVEAANKRVAELLNTCRECVVIFPDEGSRVPEKRAAEVVFQAVPRLHDPDVDRESLSSGLGFLLYLLNLPSAALDVASRAVTSGPTFEDITDMSALTLAEVCTAPIGASYDACSPGHKVILQRFSAMRECIGGPSCGGRSSKRYAPHFDAALATGIEHAIGGLGDALGTAVQNMKDRIRTVYRTAKIHMTTDDKEKRKFRLEEIESILGEVISALKSARQNGDEYANKVAKLRTKEGRDITEPLDVMQLGNSMVTNIDEAIAYANEPLRKINELKRDQPPQLPQRRLNADVGAENIYRAAKQAVQNVAEQYHSRKWGGGAASPALYRADLNIINAAYESVISVLNMCNRAVDRCTEAIEKSNLLFTDPKDPCDLIGLKRSLNALAKEAETLKIALDRERTKFTKVVKQVQKNKDVRQTEVPDEAASPVGAEAEPMQVISEAEFSVLKDVSFDPAAMQVLSDVRGLINSVFTQAANIVEVIERAKIHLGISKNHLLTKPNLCPLKEEQYIIQMQDNLIAEMKADFHNIPAENRLNDTRTPLDLHITSLNLLRVLFMHIWHISDESRYGRVSDGLYAGVPINSFLEDKDGLASHDVMDPAIHYFGPRFMYGVILATNCKKEAVHLERRAFETAASWLEHIFSSTSDKVQDGFLILAVAKRLSASVDWIYIARSSLYDLENIVNDLLTRLQAISSGTLDYYFKTHEIRNSFHAYIEMLISVYENVLKIIPAVRNDFSHHMVSLKRLSDAYETFGTEQGAIQSTSDATYAPPLLYQLIIASATATMIGSSLDDDSLDDAEETHNAFRKSVKRMFDEDSVPEVDVSRLMTAGIILESAMTKFRTSINTFERFLQVYPPEYLSMIIDADQVTPEHLAKSTVNDMILLQWTILHNLQLLLDKMGKKPATVPATEPATEEGESQTKLEKAMSGFQRAVQLIPEEYRSRIIDAEHLRPEYLAKCTIGDLLLMQRKMLVNINKLFLEMTTPQPFPAK